MPLRESEGIVDVTMDNINHVSVKVAMAQWGQPQLDLQMAIVKALKENVQILWEFVLKTS